MDWTQYWTLIASMFGGIFAFYIMTKQEIREQIKAIKEQTNLMNTHHREDMQNMDAKWERLFERLLVGNK